MHFFEISSLSIFHCFLPSAARSPKEILSRGARFQGFWDFLAHFEVEEESTFLVRDASQNSMVLPRVVCLHRETLLCGSHHVVRRLESTCDLGEMWLVVYGFVIKSVMCVSVRCWFVKPLHQKAFLIRRGSKFVVFTLNASPPPRPSHLCTTIYRKNEIRMPGTLGKKGDRNFRVPGLVRHFVLCETTPAPHNQQRPFWIRPPCNCE